MKHTIKVLTERKVVKTEAVTEEIIINIPETPQYYSWFDYSRFFKRGLVLFAILPKFSHTVIIVQVERGKQEYNDFRPGSDCNSDYWGKGDDIRQTALSIMRGKNNDFEPISKESFDTSREALLDIYKEYENDN
jgi:hypothetical protein